MILRVLGSVLLASFVSGCYVDSIDERTDAANAENRRDQGNSSRLQSCRKDFRSGCIEGQVPASPTLYVDGKSFMDANDLSNRFRELVNVESIDPAAKADDYQLNLVTPIDNRTFSRSFEVYLKGEITRSDLVSATGKFGFDYLPEGDYVVRIQRPLRIDLTRQQEVTNEDGSTATTTVTKQICATLFADVPVEVRLNEMTRHTFEQYDLYITDKDCSDGAPRNTVSL